MKKLLFILPLLLLLTGCGRNFQPNSIVDCGNNYLADIGMYSNECGERQVVGINGKYIAIAPIQRDCGSLSKAISIKRKSQCKKVKPIFREWSWIDTGYIEYTERLQTTEGN